MPSTPASRSAVVAGLLQLMLCQLVGEFVAGALRLPVPGPVIGMVVLFVVLQVRNPGAGSGLVRAADGLISHLPLLFIPVGVGVIAYVPLLAQSWLPVVGALVVGWLAALVAAAGAGAGTLRLTARLGAGSSRRARLDES